jgi:hypothetical protein
MASHQQELWGDLKPVVSVKELMRDMIDPASDFVFDAVGTVITKGKRIDKIPKTDADWERIRIGAVTMAEGAYSAQDPTTICACGRRQQQRGSRARRTLTVADQSEASRRPRPLECQDRSPAERRPGGHGDRQA